MVVAISKHDASFTNKLDCFIITHEITTLDPDLFCGLPFLSKHVEADFFLKTRCFNISKKMDGMQTQD